MWCRTWGSSQIVARISGFHSSCDANLEKPLEFQKGTKPPFELQRGNWDCSRVAEVELDLISVEVGSCVFLSHCGGKLRVPLEL